MSLFLHLVIFYLHAGHNITLQFTWRQFFIEFPTKQRIKVERFFLAGGGHLGFFGSLQRAGGGMGTDEAVGG